MALEASWRTSVILERELCASVGGRHTQKIEGTIPWAHNGGAEANPCRCCVIASQRRGCEAKTANECVPRQDGGPIPIVTARCEERVNSPPQIETDSSAKAAKRVPAYQVHQTRRGQCLQNSTSMLTVQRQNESKCNKQRSEIDEFG